MRAINVLLACLMSLLLGLAVIEGGLRLIGRGPKPTILRFDPKLGWSKEPGALNHRSGPEFDVRVVVNEQGLIGDAMPDPAKPAGTFRVAMLGDSFTQGFTVAREDLFVDLLARWWKAEGRSVDVINAGTEGWSTDQEVAWLLENGERFAPDLVLIFPYENDLYWNGEERYIDRGAPKPRFAPDGRLETGVLADPGPRPWGERWALTLLIKPLWASRPDMRHLFEPAGDKRLVLKEFAFVLNEPPDFVAPALERTGGAFRALKRKCDELGARCVAVPIPSHSAIDERYRCFTFGPKALGVPCADWSPDRPVDSFLALASAAGVETLDPRPALRKAAASGEKLYHDVDWHLNPAGNRVLADFLHGELDRTGTFPAAHLAKASVTAPPEPVEPRRFPTWVAVWLGLWALLTALYLATYRDEPLWRPPLAIALLLSAVFAIVLGGKALLGLLPPPWPTFFVIAFVLGILSFIAWKLGRRIATTFELYRCFVLRGHWYLVPLVVVLLSIGSLLVVAASSPLIAPFIYTLF
ncbi:MAG TPA: DUF5989 family protein [Planctomycetota bacterium]|nr:DUF5989 family protein [Planctomycetota bacterium]